MIDLDKTVQNHFKVHKRASLLDVLIEFDQFLDDLNVYSYKNCGKRKKPNKTPLTYTIHV